MPQNTSSLSTDTLSIEGGLFTAEWLSKAASQQAPVQSDADYAVRAGFNGGIDYLLMPLYATAFFYSGIVAREAFAPRPGRARRFLTLLAAVPIAGAILDAVENALQFSMMLWGPTDAVAGLASTVTHAKWAALIVGVVLLLGAVLGQAGERQKKAAKTGP